MKNLKNIVATLAIMLAATAQASAEDALAKIRSAGVIRIAIDLSVPPWSYKDDSLNPTGSEVEAAKLLASDLGVKMEIVATNGANRIPNLMQNRADIIMSALSITDERKKTIAFSLPYSGNTTSVFAPKSMEIKSFADLAEKRVAVTRGTTNDQDITKMAPDAEIVRFEDEATTMTSIVSNQLDIVAIAQSLVDLINQKNPGKDFEPKLTLRTATMGVGMRKEDAELKKWIDGWVRTNLDNGKLPAIYKQFQKTDIPPQVLAEAK
ncbi:MULTISPECIES: transporter substrate-binding domain-containing protein [unclassified Rhizobium]|uniref:transporter substrate-binding domain-containing protein n=1 Tax=unclassified Rhizobium TaxID=2613769 RepID=UPI000A42EAB8|nr:MULTISPECIES: transporter substrate-binding domain-containing protein [unclassified Rhizobium]PYG58346.1 polar amino acid transport system substrate-binding protein [Rhizobium sp. UGM030330-04]TKV70581.1 amino acid ABC transporter [Rhizobium sp. AU243]